MFKNRMTRKKYGSKTEEITRDLIKLHTERHNDWYSHSIIRVMK